VNEVPRKKDPRYEDAKRIAHDGDARARAKLAKRDDVAPEILYYLAEDPEPAVRRAIAGNAQTPVHADLILTEDADEAVRTDLATKIARLMPELDESTKGKVRELTFEVVGRLARDTLPRVRKVLAEALADVTGGASPEMAALIKHLAADAVLAVAQPLLERSSVLSDDDLLEIIAAHPPAGALVHMARRERVGADLADAIAADGDVEAVTSLLANKSAQIREETLDRLVDHAAEVEPWHEPLVTRPSLPKRSILKIAEFVADSLLDALKARQDIDDDTAAAVGEEVKRRLATKGAGGGKGKEDGQSPLDRAKQLKKKGKLNGDVISAAVNTNDRSFAIAALAVLAGLPLNIARDIIGARNAKAATALAWKAGLSMREAIQIQVRLAGVSPQSVIYAKDGTDYPLAPDDMEFQLEFFGGRTL
jgi:uncharacterized protein (DUF2336 family)